jgi:serine-type D-Ala-D-Ala carboxypeptidase (penicillin-binding protein 5/6)
MYQPLHNQPDKTKKINWKILVISFISLLTVSSMDTRSTSPEKVISPLPQHVDILDKLEVRSKLENRSNDYSLKEQGSFFQQAHAADTYESAASYVVTDYETGDILAEKSLNRRLPMASITKVMTAVVALDLAKPQELFTVSDDAAAQIPTKLVFTPGEQFTLEELLHAALLTSANDATEVIREGVDQKYNDEIFIKAMNGKAEFLGLKDTSFANPQGFDDANHYSSAHDLAILAHYALTNYPLIHDIVKKDYAFLPENEFHKEYDLYNWNGLIDVYPGVYGIKIGNTGNAKHTTLVVAEREGKKVIVVLLGAPDILTRDLWAAALLDVGYDRLTGLKPIDVTSDELYAKYGTWRYGS